MTSEQIRDKALSLGFSKVGVAGMAGPLREGDFLKQWLISGYHGTMEWMNRNVDRRTDPSLIVPGARSVICLAMNYATTHRHEEGPEFGKISRYAWGVDYHDILGGKVRELWEWMKEAEPSAEGRFYVDTGPVMEKVWAQRAGLGWIGKHSNLISRDAGSWLFLAEIITTLDLVPDHPETDHCGTCTLCIEACPTDAIVQPYVVDSNRCISYLTIEHRGDFDESIPLDGWIYGCDVCQDVCPWNEKFSQPAGAAGPFDPREGNRAPILQEWKEMSPQEFSERFRGSPVKRTKRDGLTRNINRVIDQRTTPQGKG
ncbi:MAG: tRNA epoxyqueuosine(34) reductase QueG [Ignavibacteria bacterium]|nr:tRNA epoxyqueuosine(34) reductase QueG [Ignavibacteria bacterium]